MFGKNWESSSITEAITGASENTGTTTTVSLFSSNVAEFPELGTTPV
jgi:hypothetical protein